MICSIILLLSLLFLSCGSATTTITTNNARAAYSYRTWYYSKYSYYSFFSDRNIVIYFRTENPKCSKNINYRNDFIIVLYDAHVFRVIDIGTSYSFNSNKHIGILLVGSHLYLQDAPYLLLLFALFIPAGAVLFCQKVTHTSMTMLKGTCSEFANAFEFVLLYFRSHLHFLLSSLFKDSKGHVL